MEDQESAKPCSNCGGTPTGPGGVLCVSCHQALENTPAREYYDALPH